MGSRKLPLEGRRALAVAAPFAQINRAAGATALSQPPASTLIPPQIPGWLDYKLPGLGGTGNGDPVKAKELLAAAGFGPGKEFELVYYYTNDDPSNVAQQVNQVRKTKLQEAGFKVKDMGVPNKERRKLIAKLDGPHNMMPVSYTHLRAHETVLDLVCRLLLEKKKYENNIIRDRPSSYT